MDGFSFAIRPNSDHTVGPEDDPRRCVACPWLDIDDNDDDDDCGGGGVGGEGSEIQIES